MRETLACALLAIALGTAAAARAAPPDARVIVVAADRIRNPDRAIRSTATVIAYKSGTPTDKMVFAVYSKPNPATGQFRDVLVYVDPPRDAGKIVLLDGDDMWFYDPASKASIRISPQQRLVGQASAGDVLVENLAVDYAATLLGIETIEDAGRVKRDCWHLMLKAADAAATYGKVEYWVERNNDRPIKAKFYADSGRLLKILYYRDYRPMDGAVRPTEAVILDAVDRSRVTTVDIGAITDRDIPDAWFQRDYLPHLKFE